MVLGFRSIRTADSKILVPWGAGCFGECADELTSTHLHLLSCLGHAFSKTKWSQCKSWQFFSVFKNMHPRMPLTHACIATACVHGSVVGNDVWLQLPFQPCARAKLDPEAAKGTFPKFTLMKQNRKSAQSNRTQKFCRLSKSHHYHKYYIIIYCTFCETMQKLYSKIPGCKLV